MDIPGLEVIRRDRRLFILVNVFYFGLVVVGLIYTLAINPELQEVGLEAITESFETGPFKAVADSYREGNVPVAAALTFVINLVLATFFVLTIPSVIPFLSLIIGGFRALAWGVIIAPIFIQDPRSLPHLLVLILEGEGYVIALYAATRLGLGVVRPTYLGAETRREAFIKGWQETARLYVVIAIVLGIAAIYEAFEVIHLLPS